MIICFLSEWNIKLDLGVVYIRAETGQQGRTGKISELSLYVSVFQPGQKNKSTKWGTKSVSCFWRRNGICKVINQTKYFR